LLLIKEGNEDYGAREKDKPRNLWWGFRWENPCALVGNETGMYSACL